MTTTIMEKQGILAGKTTLVRRVSDLFKAEVSSSGFPLPLRHTSMQKLRHCCQNLNFFPILLYSFGHPKARPMSTSKLNLALLITKITERIYRLYSSMRCAIIRGFGLESITPSVIPSVGKKEEIVVKKGSYDRQRGTKLRTTSLSGECERKFEKFEVQKPKSCSILLKLVVYLAPLLLILQLVALFSLMIFGKYSPGFVFLFSALVFLGCISMKVLTFDETVGKTSKSDKRKDD